MLQSRVIAAYRTKQFWLPLLAHLFLVNCAAQHMVMTVQGRGLQLQVVAGRQQFCMQTQGACGGRQHQHRIIAQTGERSTVVILVVNKTHTTAQTQWHGHMQWHGSSCAAKPQNVSKGSRPKSPTEQLTQEQASTQVAQHGRANTRPVPSLGLSRWHTGGRLWERVGDVKPSGAREEEPQAKVRGARTPPTGWVAPPPWSTVLHKGRVLISTAASVGCSPESCLVTHHTGCSSPCHMRQRLYMAGNGPQTHNRNEWVKTTAGSCYQSEGRRAQYRRQTSPAPE